MKKRYAIIIGIIIPIIVIVISIPTFVSMSNYAGVTDQTSQLIEKYGGQPMSDKYGQICTSTTYRMWDNTCDFSIWEPETQDTTADEQRLFGDMRAYRSLVKSDPEKYCKLIAEILKESQEMGYDKILMDHKEEYTKMCN